MISLNNIDTFDEIHPWIYDLNYIVFILYNFKYMGGPLPLRISIHLQ